MDNDRDVFDLGVESENGQFSLESILAEYKGSAYIDGDRRTPSDVLEAKAEAIVREVLGDAAPEAIPVVTGEIGAIAETEPEAPAPEEPPVPEEPPAAEAGPAPQEEPDAWEDFFASARETVEEPTVVPPTQPERAEKDAAPSEADEEGTRVFGADDGFRYADSDATKKFGQDAADGISDGAEKLAREKKRIDLDLKKLALPLGGLFKKKKEQDDVVPFDTFKAPDPEPEPEPEIPEPDLIEEAKRFHQRLSNSALRGAAAAVLCILMLIITIIANGGGRVPLIGARPAAVTGFLLILQLLVMLLGLDVLISGFDDIVKAEPGVESLVLASCVVTLLGGIIAMATGTCGEGLPFSLISSCSLYCAIRGKRLWNGAMFASLRAASASASPRSVVLDDCIEDRVVLKKISCGTDGFYRKLTEADVSEKVYLRAAPLLFLAALVFAVLASVGHGRPGGFAYSFAAMTAMATSFPAALAYALPFSLVALSAKHSGGAVAGWGGACDIYESDGALITDDDIFPAGTVRISGVKLFEGVSQEIAVQYTGSLIAASDSGSAKAFSELLKSQHLAALPVRDFACYEGGGIGGTVRGDAVLVGSSAFMNLMSIRVPKGLESRGTVFTAVNGELIAVFVVDFAPANSVKSALVAMQKTKTGMLFAVRDFNVTPHLLEQKFHVSMENVELISVGDCYKLSADSRPDGAETVAVVCRDGLGPFAEVITKGRMLRLSALISTAVSVAGGALGILFMFLMCSKEAFSSASPLNAFIFMLAVQIVVSVLSRLAVRTAK